MASYGNQDAAPRDGMMRRNRFAVLIAGPLLIIGVVMSFWYLGRNSQATEDAYVQAARLPISASIGGRVIEVDVKENQTVKAGQVLFKIDNSDYSANLARARAALADARLRALTLGATYQQTQIVLRALQTNVDFTVSEAARKQKLVDAGVSSRQELAAAVHAADEARAQMAVARQQAAVALANLGGRTDAQESYPAVMQAQADLQRAGIALGNTVVTAPSDGVVTRVEQLQVGTYINASQTVFWLISGVPWVEANFKENQLGKMKVGQPVEIKVDAFAEKFQGKVASFSPGTGAAFSPLPAQNATGNWVKVVQRLPVRIAFDGDAVLFSDEAERVFQAQGLSAFQKHERDKAMEPLSAGPFKPLLAALHRLQQEGTPAMRIRTALVTARSAPAHERAIRTLMDWNIEVDEAMFLGGLAKGEFLREFEPDFFFDDQTGHIESASRHVPSGHVASGVANAPKA